MKNNNSVIYHTKWFDIIGTYFNILNTGKYDICPVIRYNDSVSYTVKEKPVATIVHTCTSVQEFFSNLQLVVTELQKRSSVKIENADAISYYWDNARVALDVNNFGDHGVFMLVDDKVSVIDVDFRTAKSRALIADDQFV